MSNLLSGILAIIIALTSMCGGLSGASLEKAVILDAAISVDGDVSPLMALFGQGNEEQAAQMSAVFSGIFDLLKALSVRFTADKTTGRMDVLVNGESVADASVKANDAGDGWVAVSSLFPSTALTVTQDTIKQMQGSVVPVKVPGSSSFDMDILKELDMQSVMESVTEAVGGLMQTLQESVGEAEAGSFEINGVEYTVKIPVNLTTKQLGVALITAAQKVLSNESLAAFLAKNAPQFSAEKLDETLANIQNQDESQMTPMDIAQYANENGDSCFTIRIGAEEQALNILAAMAGGVINISVNGMGADIAVVVDPAAKSLSVSGTFASGEQTAALNLQVTSVSETEKNFAFSLTAARAAIGLNLTVIKGENRYDFSGNLSISMIPIAVSGFVAASEGSADVELTLSIPLSQETPPTVTLRGSMSQGEVPAVVTEGLNTVAFESMQQEEGEALNAEIMQSIGTLMQSLQTQFPIIQMLMMQQAQPVVVEEAAPAGE